jgi:hypothetical protein
VLHGGVATAAQAGHSAQELHNSYRELMTRAEAAAIFEVRPDPGVDYRAGAEKRLAR